MLSKASLISAVETLPHIVPTLAPARTLALAGSARECRCVLSGGNHNWHRDLCLLLLIPLFIEVVRIESNGAFIAFYICVVGCVCDDFQQGRNRFMMFTQVI